MARINAINCSSDSLSMPTTTATVGTIFINSIRFLHNYRAATNTFIGSASGNFTLTGGDNTCVGAQTMAASTSAYSNSVLGSWAFSSAVDALGCVAIGKEALKNLTYGEYEIAIGQSALVNMTNAASGHNIGIGVNALGAFQGTNNSNNLAIGYSVADSLKTGILNTLIGYRTGSNYTGNESGNILIMNDGVVGESNIMRLGGNGIGITKSFLAGVTSTSVNAAGSVVIANALGQLGTQTAATNVINVTTAGAVTNSLQPCFFAYKSGNTLNVTGNGTLYSFVCDTEVYDIGGNYNNGTGVFTAPVAGYYSFYGAVEVYGTTISVGAMLYFATTARTLCCDGGIRPACNLIARAQGQVIAYLAAGDTCIVQVVSFGEAADTNDITGSASPHVTYFGGRLLG